MAKQRYINTKFWSDPYIQELDVQTKLLYLYFLTNEHTNIAGVYEISKKSIEFESGIKEGSLSKAMDRLSIDNKIYFVDGFVIVKNFLKHQSRNPKIQKGIEIEMAALPDKIKDIALSTDSLSIAYDSLLHSNTNTNTNSNTNASEDALSKKKKNTMCKSDFEKFWEKYPEKTNKKKSMEKFLLLDSSLLPEILLSIEKQKTCKQWVEGFIPHPTTWINGERWNDVVTVYKPKEQEQPSARDYINNLK